MLECAHLVVENQIYENTELKKSDGKMKKRLAKLKEQNYSLNNAINTQPGLFCLLN
jgi:hypothetical protein